MITIDTARTVVEIANELSTYRKTLAQLKFNYGETTLITIHGVPSSHINLRGEERDMVFDLLQKVIIDSENRLAELGFVE